MFVSEISASFAGVAEEPLTDLDTGYEWDNEHDSSHTDAQDDTHSSDIERMIASAFLSCMSYSDASIARKMHILLNPSCALPFFQSRTMCLPLVLVSLGENIGVSSRRLHDRVGLLNATASAPRQAMCALHRDA
jgi:hypothetical protein